MNIYLTGLYWLSVFIQLLPLVTCFFYKAYNVQLKALYVYFAVSFLTEMLSNFPGFFYLNNDTLIEHIFTVFETLIILFIYQKQFQFKRKLPMLFFSALFICIAWDNFSLKYNSNIATSIECIMVIILSIIYFFRLSNDMSIPKITDFYFFWINSAFLFYFSTTFLYFLFGYYFPKASGAIWTINSTVNIFYNLLLTVGICKTKTIFR